MTSPTPSQVRAQIEQAEADLLTEICRALGWQGGTRHQALAAIESLRSQLAAEKPDAARYRHLRNGMMFSSSSQGETTMELAYPLNAPTHNLHKHWIEPEFSASVDRTVDAAIDAILDTTQAQGDDK